VALVPYIVNILLFLISCHVFKTLYISHITLFFSDEEAPAKTAPKKRKIVSTDSKQSLNF